MMDILHLSDWNKVLLAVFENGKCVPGLFLEMYKHFKWHFELGRYTLSNNLLFDY